MNRIELKQKAEDKPNESMARILFSFQMEYGFCGMSVNKTSKRREKKNNAAEYHGGYRR